jgi:hypothetical protein
MNKVSYQSLKILNPNIILITYLGTMEYDERLNQLINNFQMIMNIKIIEPLSNKVLLFEIKTQEKIKNKIGIYEKFRFEFQNKTG